MKKLFVSALLLVSTISTLGAEFNKPILLTSVGQSADVQMVKALLKKGGIDAIFDKDITASEIKDEKTLILAIGGSSKGLGAAGIKAEDEIVRAETLIQAAKDKGMKTIGMHIGGSGKRGELSDKFIYATAPKMDYLIVVKEGNQDGIFTKIAQENNIKLDSVNKIVEAVNPLKKAFE